MTWDQARQIMGKIADLFSGDVDVHLDHDAKIITVNYAPSREAQLGLADDDYRARR